MASDKPHPIQAPRLAWTVLLIGAALLAFMVTVEGEPGALPLGMLVVGIAWLVVLRLRGRRRGDDGPR